MISLFFNALAASAGAGLTYLRNVVPALAARDDVAATIALSADVRAEFQDAANLSFLEVASASSAVRFWKEQRILPRLIRKAGADVLISTGNFAIRNSPVPQILLSGNSLYTSAAFRRDLRQRGDLRLWLDTHGKAVFARRSVRWADVTVAPSEAFAKELRHWAQGKVVAIPHGFSRERFFADQGGLSPTIKQKLENSQETVKLLFVSHYNYYRNFETLLRALAWLHDHAPERRFQLILTCKFEPGANPGSYRTDNAAALVRQLDLASQVIQLGAVPYHVLHHLYIACDLYVTAAYAETFAHPLVEAMACGLPIIASDIPTHREVCGGAAVYFDSSAPQLAGESILRVAQSPELARELSQQGSVRARDFSWDQHVQQLVELAHGLAAEA